MIVGPKDERGDLAGFRLPVANLQDQDRNSLQNPEQRRPPPITVT